MWFFTRGSWINKRTGELLFPWEYSLSFDPISNHARITSNDGSKTFEFECNEKLALHMLNKGSDEFNYNISKDKVIEFVDSNLPGGNHFTVDREYLTNGITILPIMHLSPMTNNGKTFITYNQRAIEVNAEPDVISKVKKLTEVLILLTREAETQKSIIPGKESAKLLRVFGWLSFIAACAPLLFSKEPVHFAYSIGICFSGALVLVICFVMSAISDNLRVMAEIQKKKEGNV